MNINDMIDDMMKALNPHLSPENVMDDVMRSGNKTVVWAVAIAVATVLWRYQKETAIPQANGEIDLAKLGNDLKTSLRTAADRIIESETRRGKMLS